MEMQRIATPPIDKRLQKRYLMLVQSHLQAASTMAAGISALPDVAGGFAATQGAWRFLNNDRVPLSALAEPLRDAGRRSVETLNEPFVLVVHDWCKVTFESRRKKDAVQLTHETDIGYELYATLLVSADDGAPLAPLEIDMKTGKGILSTRSKPPRRRNHLDQVLPMMRTAANGGLAKPVVHVIDREADSVGHYREWDRQGFQFLIRGDDRRVRWNGSSMLLSEIAKTLKNKREFKCCGTASYQGRKAQLWVAETSIVLHRPAMKNDKGKRFAVPGKPLDLRFIVVQIRNQSGQVLAEWLLLSNVPAAWADAEKLARCYYWRWRIESFFKLLKSHGQQLEYWDQSTGPAIARRLLVAAMACVVVWNLQNNDTPAATELKDVLVKLSGRQMKRTRPHTAPALLSGLWVLLSMLHLMEHYDLQKLQRLAHHALALNTS